VKVLVFVDGGQVVEDGLQLVLLDAVAHEDELLDEQQHEGADRHDLILRGTRAILLKK